MDAVKAKKGAVAKNNFHDPNSGNSPKVIIANTIKGKGVSFMENSVAWHYKSPNKDELDSSLKEILNEK